MPTLPLRIPDAENYPLNSPEFSEFGPAGYSFHTDIPFSLNSYLSLNSFAEIHDFSIASTPLTETERLVGGAGSGRASAKLFFPW